MGLQMTPREVAYHRKQFWESLDVHGIPCKIYSIGESYEDSYDFYGDVNDKTPESKFISTRITYDTLPSIKTLRSLGWYIDGEEFPAVAHIPVLYKDTERNFAEFFPKLDDEVVVISNPIDPNSSERHFLLKDFKGQGFPNVIYYICKLVPKREDA